AIAGVDESKPAEHVEIEFEGFEARAVQLPIAAGNLGNLEVNDKGQLLYVRRGPNGGIKLFDPADAEGGEKNVMPGGGFSISAEGSKIMVPTGGGASIAPATANASGKPVVKSPMLVEIAPREEWRQLVRDAWRIQRDWFYEPTLHGVDWDGVLAQYLPMVDSATSREDVSYIIGEMIGELNVGHAYYWGGDGEDAPSLSTGMLGAEFEIVPDGEGVRGLRLAKILGGADFDTDARSPLAAPGLDAKEGDFLLAVNGVPIDLDQAPWAAFQGLAGKTVVLTLSDRATMGDDARQVPITLLGDESALRYRGWIEQLRQRVLELSDGKVGYIYVPNTGVDGQTDLVRQFHGQAHLPGLVIDERWNGGGQIPTRFIELLNRPVTNYWARRDGQDWTWPPDGHQGAKAMLINGLAGSGGDMFPWLFKRAGLGPLVGTRTWGGLVGISGNPTLIDGGYTAVPTFGFYETDGTWGIEGHGVDPDVEVIDDPALMMDGGDPQLEKAVELVLEQIGRTPYTKPARPASPNRSGMGIVEEDK
ncbi:MAG: S41 family peptidase, partial [Phycisphaerales bacterium]